MDRKLALAGITTAFALLLMFVAMLPGLTYVAPFFAGFLLWRVIADQRLTIIAYVATSILSILLVPEQEAVLIFVMFLGYYPLLRAKIMTLKFGFLRVLLKLIAFNIPIILMWKGMVYIYGSDKMMEGLDAMFGLDGEQLLLFMANFCFLFYDLLYSRFELAYTRVLKRRLSKAKL